MPRRRCAQDAKVNYHRSREQIARLLEDWGATGVQWTDEWKPEPLFVCRFQWTFEDAEGAEHPLMAKFVLNCDDEHLREISEDLRTGGLSESKYANNRKQWVNRTHRLLLLLLKAMFNAIDEGLWTPEELFATFVEHQNGMTVGQMLAANVSKLSTSSAQKLLSGSK
jgi:hypothetical protein